MSTVHLGSLGQERDPIDADFMYLNKVRIRVHPDATDLELTSFMEKAARISMNEEEMDEQVVASQASETLLAVMSFMRQQIHPDDWDLFWDTAKKYRQTTRDLMEISQELVAAVAGFPTGPPSASSGGRSPTRKKSKGNSSSRGSRPREQRVFEQALEETKGRPDRQEVVVQMHEVRTGRRAG